MHNYNQFGVFPFHATPATTATSATLYFVIHFVHKKLYHANILVYKVNGKKKVADFKGCMKRKHPDGISMLNEMTRVSVVLGHDKLR